MFRVETERFSLLPYAVLQKTFDAMSLRILLSCLFCLVQLVISASLINFSRMLNCDYKGAFYNLAVKF